MSGHAERPRVAVATCSEVPDLDADGLEVVAALTDAGLRATPAVWDDPAVDWATYDVVLVRSTWDYAERRDEFLAWAARVTTGASLVNPLEVLRWNTDKTYLRDLADDGVPIVPTMFVSPGGAFAAPEVEEYVVKPAVSAGSRSTARYGAGDAARAREHAHALLAAERTVMIQPYVAAVDEVGETALVYLDGVFSHALRKGPLLERGAGLIDSLFAPEEITALSPTEEELMIGAQVVGAVERRFGSCAYGRVDLVAGEDGRPLLLEVELTEPSLFLAEGGADARLLAAAVQRALA